MQGLEVSLGNLGQRDSVVVILPVFLRAHEGAVRQNEACHRAEGPAVFPGLFRQVVGGFFVIALFDPKQNQQPVTDSGNLFPGDTDSGTADALYDGTHFSSSPFCLQPTAATTPGWPDRHSGHHRTAFR